MKIEDAIARCRKHNGTAFTHKLYAGCEAFLAWAVNDEGVTQYRILSGANVIIQDGGVHGFMLDAKDFISDGWILINLADYSTEDVATRVAQRAFETGGNA